MDKQHDIRRVITKTTSGQEPKVTKSKLKSGALKYLVRSLRTSILVTKLCYADHAVRKYLLYILLDACLHASEHMNVPVELRK